MRTQVVRLHPDPILYRISPPVTDENREWAAEVEADLIATMEALEARTGKRALGLSAPQIGAPLRMFVMAHWPRAVCNPTVEIQGPRTATEVEACLSLPGVKLEVTRADRIKVRYELVDGHVRAPEKLRGRFSRVFQHEADHLDGITILHRANAVEGLPEDFASFG